MLSEDSRRFDAQFFGIKPVEANAVDPQQRILLETVYESLESAGLTVDGLQGSNTGVYVGLMCGDYEAMLLRDYMWMSERDFHQVFAEDVLASRPESGLELEISPGLQRVATSTPYLPIWYNNPKFARFVVEEFAAVSEQSPVRAGSSIKSQLLATTTREEVYKILEGDVQNPCLSLKDLTFARNFPFQVANHAAF